MTDDAERAYLEKRAREERERAEQAADPCAYKTHVELAREYERRLSALLGKAADAAQPDRRAHVRQAGRLISGD